MYKGLINDAKGKEGREDPELLAKLRDLDAEANLLDSAVHKVLDDGLRTIDIMSKGKKEVSTSVMGDAIISKLK